MSEQQNETPDEPAAVEGAPEGAADAGEGAGGAEDVGTADGGESAGSGTAQHVSSATDLPEGAEIDPLTDQQPVPVEDQDTHDG